MNRLLIYLTLVAATLQGCAAGKAKDKVVVAYVTSWSRVMPDPAYVTHINYAFGHVNATFDGVRIDNPERLKALATLKRQKPSLKILLSIGGWESGRFSEMAADPAKRESFARDCARVVEEFSLDGIDIDWEYPTSNMAGISASPDDTGNYTLLMRDIRIAIGGRRMLTLASAASAKYIDFKAIMRYVDFVNIMTYDMAQAPGHHSAMYRSPMTTGLCCKESVEAHIAAGIPVSKLVLGIPFYGRARGELSNFIDYNKIIKLEGYRTLWDEQAQAPYLVNARDEVVCTFDNPQSIQIKCEYIFAEKLRGAMYWDYAGDDEHSTLRKTVFKGVKAE